MNAPRFSWRLFLSVCLLSTMANAQEANESQGVDIERERARIQAEQLSVQARFDSESAACYLRFAVNDCVGQQRSVRRERLDDLRRQQVALNQMERALRAQQQLQRIRGKMQSD